MSHRSDEFQRARSEEQRAARRQAILGTAVEMLAEMPVADLSLNELSRRVGLAKSNVLRYFESREAVLLELLDEAGRRWLARLAEDLGADPPPVGHEQVAAVVAGSLAAEPLFCELVSVSASVLERNVSPDVAARFKRAAIDSSATLAGLVGSAVPELGPTGAGNFAAGIIVAVSGVWPLARPAEAMLRAYERDPSLAAGRHDFPHSLREVLTTMLAGCLARWPRNQDGLFQGCGGR